MVLRPRSVPTANAQPGSRPRAEACVLRNLGQAGAPGIAGHPSFSRCGVAYYLSIVSVRCEELGEEEDGKEILNYLIYEFDSHVFTRAGTTGDCMEAQSLFGLHAIGHSALLGSHSAIVRTSYMDIVTR